jgi:hypothetical protein
LTVAQSQTAFAITLVSRSFVTASSIVNMPRELHPHHAGKSAPSAVTLTDGANGKSYTYDANGNMLNRGTQSIAYSGPNRPPIPGKPATLLGVR